MISQPKTPFQLLGIDGCRAGWVVASSSDLLVSATFSIIEKFSTIVDIVQGQNRIAAIDIPIGLSSSGSRQCDIEARRRLARARKSSVFPSPCRQTLRSSSYQEACTLNKKACGKKISQQLFAILGKIAEVDRLMTPDLQSRILETHPEVVFARLNGGGGLEYPKASTGGQDERLALLRWAMPWLDRSTLESERRRIVSNRRAHEVELDDLVDAAVCLLVAERISIGSASVIPEGRPHLDDRGLRMEMVF